MAEDLNVIVNVNHSRTVEEGTGDGVTRITFSVAGWGPMPEGTDFVYIRPDLELFGMSNDDFAALPRTEYQARVSQSESGWGNFKLTITVDIKWDSEVELDEAFSLYVSSVRFQEAGGSVLDVMGFSKDERPESPKVTIENDDFPPEAQGVLDHIAEIERHIEQLTEHGADDAEIAEWENEIRASEDLLDDIVERHLHEAEQASVPDSGAPSTNEPAEEDDNAFVFEGTGSADGGTEDAAWDDRDVMWAEDLGSADTWPQDELPNDGHPDQDMPMTDPEDGFIF